MGLKKCLPPLKIKRSRQYSEGKSVNCFEDNDQHVSYTSIGQAVTNTINKKNNHCIDNKALVYVAYLVSCMSDFRQ